MNITINHSRPGTPVRKQHFVGTAVAAAVATVGVYAVVSYGSNTSTAPTRAAAVAESGAQGAARLAAVNEIPWQPTTAVVTPADHLTTINDIPWQPTAVASSSAAGVVDAQAELRSELEAINGSVQLARMDAADQGARLRSLNELPWGPTAPTMDVTGTQTTEQAYFLDINGVDDGAAASAPWVAGNGSFFLAINGVDG